MGSAAGAGSTQKTTVSTAANCLKMLSSLIPPFLSHPPLLCVPFPVPRGRLLGANSRAAVGLKGVTVNYKQNFSTSRPTHRFPPPLHSPYTWIFALSCVASFICAFGE